MSRAELQKFTEALEADASLAEEFGALGDSPEAWRRKAEAKGYRLTLEEAEGLCASQRELGDDELEAVAGGWDGGTGDPGDGGGGG